MVQLDKIQGQKGHMVIQEDGTVISSSGELASNETVSQHIIGLVSQNFPVNFAGEGGGGDGNHLGNGSINGHGHTNGFGDSRHFKWNRITVGFRDKSYTSCMSNRKIHVAKREHENKLPTESLN